MAETAIDPTEYPRYMFHPTADPQRVETPEDEAALPGGWRRTQYSDAEKLALLDAQAAAQRTAGERMHEQMTTSVSDDAVDEERARKDERNRYDRAKRQQKKREQNAAYQAKLRARKAQE